jgi:hypothetical protein
LGGPFRPACLWHPKSRSWRGNRHMAMGLEQGRIARPPNLHSLGSGHEQTLGYFAAAALFDFGNTARNSNGSSERFSPACRCTGTQSNSPACRRVSFVVPSGCASGTQASPFGAPISPVTEIASAGEVDGRSPSKTDLYESKTSPARVHSIPTLSEARVSKRAHLLTLSCRWPSDN